EREINTVDLSKVVLTHHHLRDLGTRTLDLQQGESIPIAGMAPGGGSVQDKDKVELAEIIAKLNDLFGGELSDGDKVTYVRSVIRGRLLESHTLRQQAAANSKEQFANSPDFGTELMDAIIGALDAHQAMSSQALNSSTVRDGIKDVLLNHTNLWEDLRKQGQRG
ncbi:MAG: type I restriction endonuclease subunit R, partial [Cyanobacteriota bacterium]